MQPLASFLVRLLTCIGDVYYLLLVPLLCLYLAIFVSNKFQSHQQQRQQHTTQHESPHRRRSSAAQDEASAAPSPSGSLSLSSPSPSHAHLSDATSVDSIAFDDTSFTSSPIVSAPTSPTSSASSSSSSSSLLSLSFLLPDQSLVNHSFPLTTPVSSIIATLYPPPSPLQPSARLIYQGRLLHPTTTLSTHNMSHDDIVHVHLLHTSHPATTDTVRGIGGGVGWVGGGSGEPPGGLVCVLAVLCAGLGGGWGVFVVCGGVVFDLLWLCVLLCVSALTAVGVLYAHACAVSSQRPAVVPV